MIEVIAATNREGSSSEQIAKIVVEKLKKAGAKAQALNLKDLDWGGLNSNLYGPENTPEAFKPAIKRVNESDGIYIVCPEYNGSFPGVIKAFIDHWTYPKSFLHRPIAFLGLGGRFGGLRPIEHLQQIFGYRDSYIFPERVFVQNVWDHFKEGKFLDESYDLRIEKQAQKFVSFVESLKSAELHSHTRKD